VVKGEYVLEADHADVKRIKEEWQ